MTNTSDAIVDLTEMKSVKFEDRDFTQNGRSKIEDFKKTEEHLWLVGWN